MRVSKFLPLLILASCSGLPKTTHLFENPSLAAARQEPQVPPLYRKGLEQLENGEDQAAIESFDKLQIDQPASSFTQVAIFNSARAYEDMGDCKNAVDRYRQVARATERLAPRLQALALYSMSFCFESLGEDTETVASLHDAYARISQLPVEIARAELPARLASAYARAGNFAQAKSYYAQAETGVARLRQNMDRKEIPEWLPRTLYFMGHLNLGKISWENFETDLRPLGQSQVYLLESTELSTGAHLNQWSKKSGDELLQTYKDIWSIFETQPVAKGDDAIVAQQKTQKEKWTHAQTLLDYLKKLDAYRLPPEKPSNSKVTEIYELSKALQLKLNAILQEPSVTQGLTPDAQKRLQQVRGHVLNPDQSLEQGYQEKEKPKAFKLPRKKITPPKPQAQPAPEPSPAAPQIDVKDPNI